jgi:hypothetical protein
MFDRQRQDVRNDPAGSAWFCAHGIALPEDALPGDALPAEALPGERLAEELPAPEVPAADPADRANARADDAAEADALTTG